jgi:hypothetical protein
MVNYTFIKQPPLSKKFNFLVDALTENKKYGETTDIEKIEYNLEIFGNDVKIDLEISDVLLTKKSIATVIPIGKYITILMIDKGRNFGRMVFIQFDKEADIIGLEKILIEEYDINIANEWVSVYKKYKEHFSDKDDNAELLVI